jgi:hypothetical protein
MNSSVGCNCYYGFAKMSNISEYTPKKIKKFIEFGCDETLH